MKSKNYLLAKFLICVSESFIVGKVKQHTITCYHILLSYLPLVIGCHTEMCENFLLQNFLITNLKTQVYCKSDVASLCELVTKSDGAAEVGTRLWNQHQQFHLSSSSPQQRS